jgi:hypothetical protein
MTTALGGKPKGSPKTGGRAKGTPNKMTKALKDMILQALDGAGGVEYLKRQATENPGPFMTLVGKVLPLQVTGEGGGPVKYVRIETGIPHANDDADLGESPTIQ